jgi:class 3 adenylate cyclase/tetratricopeptide (TPR) repeat protein
MPICSSCGQTNPDGFRFCGACGLPLQSATPAPRSERKTVTVLFADIVGFTSLADRLDPEDVRWMIEPFHEQLREEVARLGGTVEKFLGDAAMAVFGMEQAHEDDPERAVRAALAIRDATSELAETAQGAHLAVRIGVNTGEALVMPSIRPGEGERIVADFVNVAARLQAAAPVNGILVGEPTYRATARTIEYRAFEPVKAKGKVEPVLAWEAVSARSRVGADRRDRGRAPLVGRLPELEILGDAFDLARRERSAQLVVLVGPPGIGKSRLVFELSSVVEDDPELVYWRRGACPPYGEGLAFRPVAEMVKAQAGILETDQAAEVADKLHREIEEALPAEDEAAWVEGHLRILLGLSTPGEGPGDLEQHFAAWRRFYESLAEHSPLVLVFEDLHWADEGLLDFIDYLVEWATEAPMLVVASARTELLARRPSWGASRPRATVIHVPPLSDPETGELLEELLDLAMLPDDRDLRTRLVARAGGNPLYAEEFVRMLADRGPVEPGEELPVPDSVHGIIAARLDALPAGEKATMQDAAVIGRVFWAGAVAQVGSTPRGTVDDRLRSLERKQFLRRERQATVEDETEYVFRHLLVREEAYSRIPRARRIEQHRLTAEWFESLGRPEDHSETIAHHYATALELARASGRPDSDLVDRTRAALREAGDRAGGLKAFTTAARLYGAALELWPRDEPGWPALRFRHGRALFFAEEAGGDALAEARDALLEAGDREAAAEAEVLLGGLSFRQGQGDRASAHYERAAALLVDAPPSASKARVLGALARGLVVAAKSEEAGRIAQEALVMAKELGLEDLEARALMTIGDTKLELGDPEGLADFERGIEMAVALNSHDSMAGRINLADCVMDLGDLDRAVELRAEARQEAEYLGATSNIRWLRAERAGELYWQGEWDEALRMADTFVAESESGRRHYQESYCRVVRGRIRLARGETDEAVRDAERAVEFARAVKDPQALFPALAFRARALAASGDDAGAGAVADELLALVREMEKTPVAYLWLLDLAVVLVDLERGEDLVQATERVKKATPWLEAARAIASGDAGAAAEQYARIGARPDEALARLHAAGELVTAGRMDEAAAELERARDFYRAVGATAAVEACERLLEDALVPGYPGESATSSPPSSS